MNLTQIVRQFRNEYQALGDTINTLGTMVLGEAGTRGVTTRNNTPVHASRIRAARQATTPTTTPVKRTLTPAGRKAIAIAQKKRWAVLKGGEAKKAA